MPLHRFGSLSPFLLLLFLLWCPLLTCYEPPEDFEDVFGRRACPAFLTFSNAAYVTGTTVELPCYCKPKEVLEVVWFHKKHRDSWEETRALTDLRGTRVLDSSELLHSGDLRSRFSIRLFSLLIFKAGPQDSGLYVCGSAHNDYFFGYDLDVQEVRARRFTSSISIRGPARRSGKGKRSSAAPLYQVFRSYQPWSVCDRCGVKGEQVRVGLCYVCSQYLQVRYRGASQAAVSCGPVAVPNREDNQTFPVSCGSGGVPSAFGLTEHSTGGAEMQVRECHAPCPPQAPSSQKSLDLARFLGYGSPSDKETLPVFYLNHPAWQPLVLGCPGSRPHMVVAWDRERDGESAPIYRSEHSVGRVIIDTGHLLVFTPAIGDDSGKYYCWLQGRRAAEIHLLVYAHLGKRMGVTSHPEFKSSLWMVLISYVTMTIVFSALMLGRVGFGHLPQEHQTFLSKVGRQQVSRVKSIQKYLLCCRRPNQLAARRPHPDPKQPAR